MYPYYREPRLILSVREPTHPAGLSIGLCSPLSCCEALLCTTCFVPFDSTSVCSRVPGGALSDYKNDESILSKRFGVLIESRYYFLPLFLDGFALTNSSHFFFASTLDHPINECLIVLYFPSVRSQTETHGSIPSDG